MNSRVERMFNRWYKQPKYRMSVEDWRYCGLLLWACLLAFGLGLVIGLAWTRFL